MKRRLTISRAVVNEPELVLLDEPTTGLDPQARHLVWDRLHRLKQQGVTIVLTTHYMDEAEQLCDRLVVMDKAKIVMAALGLVISPWALLALPAATLIGFTFAAVGTAASTFVRTWKDFDLVLTVLIPIFLFSATFYPITTYPGPLQVVVQLTPLYHGVDLLRSLTTGMIGPSILLDIAYLVIVGAAALVLAATRLERLLLK
jgi:energy-coupling factor transporter ATP-binding protein EcfA2